MTPRVLLCGRADLLTKPGGDTRQILGLQRHLGDSARLSLDLRPQMDDVDLVHVFNLSRPIEPALQADQARRRGKPVVLTPIYQDLREYNRHGRHGAGRLLFRLLGGHDGRLETVRALVNLWRSSGHGLRGLPLVGRAVLTHGGRAALGLQARVLENCDLLVFNSSLEEETVRSCITGATIRAASARVPVGIDTEELSSADPTPFLRRFGLARGFVLSVGRIEDVKNQLALIQSLRGDSVPLVLVGQVNPLHRAYARAVARAAGARPSTLVIHRLGRTLLLSAMAAAAVHVLPSWFETAGLVSLEAAAAGCAVVSTDRGYARAFLGDEAHYCSPSEPLSIRRAVLDALERGPSHALRTHVLAQLTEQRAAAMMHRLYRQVLA